MPVRLRDTLLAAVSSGGVALGVGLALLLQEVVVARQFGAGKVTDAFQLATQFPQLLLHVFAGGALHGALLPLLVRTRYQGRDAVTRSLAAIFWYLGAVLLVVALLVALLLPQVIAWLSPGTAAETVVLARKLVWIAAPMLLFGGLASLYSVALISHHAFALAVAPQALPALTLIAATLTLAPRYGIHASAAGLLLGSALQLGLAFQAARALDITAPPWVSFAGYPLLEAWRHYWPAALSIALMTAMFAAGLLQAYTLGPGAAAVFGYASRPVLLVSAFMTVTVGNSVLPFFTREVHARNWHGLRRLLGTWSTLMLVLSLALVGLWSILAERVVQFLYEGGAFDRVASAQVCGTQQVFLFLLPCALLGMLFTRVGNALGWNGRMLPAAALALVTELLGGPYLAAHWGLRGVAGAVVLGYAVWMLVLGLIVAMRPWGRA